MFQQQRDPNSCMRIKVLPKICKFFVALLLPLTLSNNIVKNFWPKNVRQQQKDYIRFREQPFVVVVLSLFCSDRNFQGPPGTNTRLTACFTKTKMRLPWKTPASQPVSQLVASTNVFADHAKQMFNQAVGQADK